MYCLHRCLNLAQQLEVTSCLRRWMVAEAAWLPAAGAVAQAELWGLAGFAAGCAHG